MEKYPCWTNEEIQFLREHFESMSDREISQKMNRTESAVKKKD